MNKPSIPKGTRDFSPAEMNRRNYIFDTIKSVFRLFGYQQIETPSQENLSTLLGKYGEEGDKLIFKILNSGPVLDEIREKKGDMRISEIAEKGLRYDLTVPFARYVVMHRNEIIFPFKRYQVQPVWRADRPQKGRYREFYQCDVDVIGSKSLLNEAELLKIVDVVFEKFGIEVLIKLNNRKILSGIAEKAGVSDRFQDFTIAIDKLDKAGVEGVNEELISKGFAKNEVDTLLTLINLKENSGNILDKLETELSGTKEGIEGVNELKAVFDYTGAMNLKSSVEIDLTLARGLNYYTGCIIEVKALGINIGSICGGGRYDDLTGIFGLPDVSGVGISFGADRIYDVLNELNKFPEGFDVSVKLLFANLGSNEELYCLRLMNSLQENGIACELYPDHDKLKKQFAFADNRKIPFVAVAGSEEIENNRVTIKNMFSGEQTTVSASELPDFLKRI